MSKIKRILYVPGVVLSGIAAMAIPVVANAASWYNPASWLTIGDVGSSLIADVAFFFSYILALIGGIVIGIEAWIIGVVLNINTGIFQTAIVRRDSAYRSASRTSVSY